MVRMFVAGTNGGVLELALGTSCGADHVVSMCGKHVLED
jgi:hypothetical protein